MNKYIAVIVSLLLTACSSTEEFFQDDDSGKTPMSLTFGLSGAENGVTSRAVVSSFGTSDEIGVCLRSGASTATYDGIAYENLKYNASSHTLTSGTTPMLSASTGYVYAYYPYTSSVSDITAIPMPDAQTDYMYGSANTTVGDNTIVTCDDHNATKTVYMHHAKALMTFKITRGTYKATGKVSTIRVSGTNITGTGKLNITTCAVTPDAKADVMVYNEQTIPSGSGSITQNMLVISKTTSTQDVTVYFVIDGTTYTIALYSATIKNQYQTNVNLTLDETGLTLNSVGIGTWNELATINGDFGPNSGESLHDYVEIGGLKWATMNLGATSVADDAATAYGDYYAWGATETWYSSLSWSGTPPTFTWKSGYNDGYSDSHTPSVSATTLPLTQDAARKAWGGKWRIPTLADFKSLFSACGVTITENSEGSYSTTDVISSSQSSLGKGVYRINTKKGAITIGNVLYSVTGTLFIADASDTSKWLFLPGAGYCSDTAWQAGATDSSDQIRTECKYWSASAGTANTSGSFLLDMYYNKYQLTDSESSDVSRSSGLSIRPVSD